MTGDEAGGDEREGLDGLELEDGGGRVGERGVLCAFGGGAKRSVQQSLQHRAQVRRPHRTAHLQRRRLR